MVAIRERDECQFVKCCFSCPGRVAAKHTQEANVKSDICMCAASTMFARRRENHMKQDSKGEIQQDSLLYYHGNPTLMKSRKTIKYLWKKKSVLWISTGLREDALMESVWYFYHLMVSSNKAIGAAFGKSWLKKHSIY